MPSGDSAISSLDCGPELLALCDKVGAAGGRLWAVGGTIRDALLGLPRSEWDLATDLDVERIAGLLPVDAPQRIEPELGAVATTLDEIECVVTRLREESAYGANRRPARVRFIDDPLVDADRRDFTVNAIYLQLPDGELVDPMDGQADLAAGILRVIGEPKPRLSEDPLRVLRGIRFAARYRLVVDPDTRAGLRVAAERCSALSGERARSELEAAFGGEGRGRAVLLAQQLGALGAVLPELGTRSPESWLWVGRLLEELKAPDAAEIWAALAGDAATGDAIARRLVLPRPLRRRIDDLLRLSTRLADWESLARNARREALREHWRADSEAFLRACSRAWLLPTSRFETLARDLRHLRVEGGRPLIRGADILAAGVPAGPKVGAILGEIRGALNSGVITGRAAALAMLRRLVAGPIKPEAGESRYDGRNRRSTGPGS